MYDSWLNFPLNNNKHHYTVCLSNSLINFKSHINRNSFNKKYNLPLRCQKRSFLLRNGIKDRSLTILIR